MLDGEEGYVEKWSKVKDWEVLVEKEMVEKFYWSGILN